MFQRTITSEQCGLRLKLLATLLPELKDGRFKTVDYGVLVEPKGNTAIRIRYRRKNGIMQWDIVLVDREGREYGGFCTTDESACMIYASTQVKTFHLPLRVRASYPTLDDPIWFGSFTDAMDVEPTGSSRQQGISG